MKTALVTTTINVPTVLKLYRACSEDVRFFVAHDRKSEFAAEEFARELPNCLSLTIADQSAFGYSCSDLIGWNTIGRRSIAILEALKWGADIIVTIDDDNLCLSTDYFDRFEMALSQPFNGIQVSSEQGWFDVGRLLDPESPHRGAPHNVVYGGECKFAVDVKVGVAAGICLGDPDISATTRITRPRYVHHVSELLRAGIVVEPNTWTVFNSQNTAFLRELAPCFLMVPQFGRYDDIFASLIAQRVMRERNMHVHFGQPFVWQQRNPHDLLKDLRAEMLGMQHILDFAAFLDNFVFKPDQPVVEMVRAIYTVMGDAKWMPAGVSELGLAWCDDCEKVL